tara:strand:+ start:20639 stop:21148 length:510 start_codon:yes stop_codon:yes gene_type:complete
MTSTKKDYWFNQKQMAASVGISSRAFQDWNVKPVAIVGREKFYDAREVLENRLAHLESKSTGEAGDIEAERLRLTKAQADNMEIKNEIALGKIAPIEIIQIVLNKVSTEAAGILDSIPLNIRRKHPQLENLLIEEIKRHVVKAQNAISSIDLVLNEALDEYIEGLDDAK